MSIQLQLDFTRSGICCDYCGEDPGIKEISSVVWNGFLDKDTGQHVCFRCRDAHYQKKFEIEDFKGLYSEFPVVPRQSRA